MATCRPFQPRALAEKCQLHAVFLNPYPIGPLSGVLCPFLFEKRAQDLGDSLDALSVALHFARDLNALAAPPALKRRVGFNSLGARASINHLHFQFWAYADGPDGLLPLERAPLRGVPTTFPDTELFVIDHAHHPIQSLALTGSSVEAVAEAAAHCIDVLMRRNTAFSLLSNGRVLYIIPRAFSNASFPFASAGFPEAAGELLVTDATYWRDDTLLNADIVWKLWREAYDLPGSTVDAIAAACGKRPIAGEGQK